MIINRSPIGGETCAESNDRLIMGKAKHINNKDASVTKEKMEVTIVILMKGERGRGNDR